MGTASARPVSDSFQSAQVLNVHGRFFLIDCGEGVQISLIRHKISLLKIDAICISHIHGDHVFGIFGLLSTMGMMGRTATLPIFAPSNFGPILKFFLSYYGAGLNFDIDFTPLTKKEPEVVFDKRKMSISAFPLNHKIDTYGFIFREKEPMLNVDKNALEKYKFTLAEIGALKRGEDIVRPAGKDDSPDFMNGFVKYSGTDEDLVIKNDEVAYRPYEPRSYAYCSDTAPFPELASFVSGVDVLYHEATYLNEYEDLAAERHHSTTSQAAQCALDAGVGKLIVGHYSARCTNPLEYEKECKKIFPNTKAAKDGDLFKIPFLKKSGVIKY